jgi:hypothetical protein
VEAEMTRAILLSVAICCFALALAADPGLCHAGDADDSERIMEEAAELNDLKAVQPCFSLSWKRTAEWLLQL